MLRVMRSLTGTRKQQPECLEPSRLTYDQGQEAAE